METKQNLNIENRTIYCNDNLNILRGMNNDCIDLIYLDPPFNSGRDYGGARHSMAELAQFKDSWDEDDENIEWWFAIKEKHPRLYLYLKDVDDYANKSMQVYLTMMAVRMLEMHRVLKSTGSLYYHCDQSAGHYIKVMLDIVFGVRNFVNEIIWCYKSGGASKKHFSRKHDCIYLYSKDNRKMRFNFQKEKSYNRGLKPYRFKDVEEYQDSAGWYTLVGMKDYWMIDMVGRTSNERTGYPTQKPLALLERIISASSNEGDTILDPFCGCATTCVAAEKLGRQWIGIDVWEDAHNSIQKRLFKDFDLWEGGTIHHLTTPPKRTDTDPNRKEIRKRKRITDEIKEQVWTRDEGACKTCGTNENLQYNHIVPFSKGGNNEVENLQILCRNCNLEKSNKHHS